MLKDISTISTSVAMQFYSEVMIKAMQEQEAKIEDQEAKINALTQLVNKLYENPDALAEELAKCFPDLYSLPVAQKSNGKPVIK